MATDEQVQAALDDVDESYLIALLADDNLFVHSLAHAIVHAAIAHDNNAELVKAVTPAIIACAKLVRNERILAAEKIANRRAAWSDYCKFEER